MEKEADKRKPMIWLLWDLLGEGAEEGRGMRSGKVSVGIERVG